MVRRFKARPFNCGPDGLVECIDHEWRRYVDSPVRLQDPPSVAVLELRR